MNEKDRVFTTNYAKKTILNLGCGDQGFGTHRVDILETATSTHVFDVENGLPFSDGFFDEVYERNLLEHIRNVSLHLGYIYRVLKVGGYITIITDYAGCMRYYKLGTHEGRYEKVRKNNLLDRHYSIFTKNHLKNHLSYVGFKEIKIEFIHTTYPTRWIDKLMGVYPRLKAEAMK